MDYAHILKSILNHAPFLVSLKDADGCYALVNPLFQQTVGMDSDEIIGRKDGDIFPAPVAAVLAAHDREAAGTAAGIDVREDLPLSGSLHPFISHKFPLLSEQGEVAFLCSISREVIPHANSRELTSLDLLPHLVWVAGPDGTGVFSNSRWQDYTGTTFTGPAHEVWGCVLHPDDLVRTVDRWEYSLRTGEPFEIEHRIRSHLHGNYRWFLGRGIPVRERGSGVIRWLGSHTDIDGQKQVEESLKNGVDCLNRTNRELEQFALASSQNLEEPLRILATYLHLLQQRYQPGADSAAESYIDVATGACGRMQELIDSLLAYAQIARSADFQPVDLNTVVVTAAGELGAVMAESETEFSSDVLPTVWGDMEQLILLMKHLIANAITFRSPAAAPRIRVSCRTIDGQWEFTVRDNGIGIEPHYLGRIFLPFQRLHQEEEYPGTGIGLAMCRKIVEHHMGRMWAESRPGDGSTFYFTLPSLNGGGSSPSSGSAPFRPPELP